MRSKISFDPSKKATLHQAVMQTLQCKRGLAQGLLSAQLIVQPQPAYQNFNNTNVQESGRLMQKTPGASSKFHKANSGNLAMLYTRKKLQRYTNSKLILGLTLLSLSSLAQAQSSTLTNLERERSALLDTITAEQLSPGQRANQVAQSQRRLQDLERMVIRDDRLLGSKDPMVKKAFNSYDTTFLVHASAEAKQYVVDFWLAQLQLDNEQVMSSRKGRR